MRSVTEPLKRVANRRKSIKSKTGFMLEIHKVIFPSHISIDIESEYSIYFQRGDKIFKTSFRSIINEDGLNVIYFNESISLSTTMFLDISGKYLEKEGKISLQRKKKRIKTESVKQIGCIGLNLAALVSCTTPIDLNLQIEPIPGIQISLIVLPQSCINNLGNIVDSDSQLTTETSDIVSRDFENVPETDSNLSPVSHEEVEDNTLNEELQKKDELISSQKTKIEQLEIELLNLKNEKELVLKAHELLKIEYDNIFQLSIELQQKISTNNQIFQNKTEEYEKILQKNISLQNQIEQINSHLKEYQSNLDLSKENEEKIKLELSNKQQSYEELDQQFSNINGQYQQLQNNYNQQNKTIKNLQETNNNYHNELKTLNDTILQLSKQIPIVKHMKDIDIQVDIEIIDTNNQLNSEDEVIYKENVQKLESELKNKIQIINGLQDNLQLEIQLKNGLSTQNDAYVTEIKKLESQLSTLAASPTRRQSDLTYKIKFQTVEKENITLKKDNIEKDNEINELYKQLTEEMKNSARLQEQNEILEEKIQLLERSTIFISPSRSKRLHNQIISSSYYIYDVVLRDRIFENGIVVYKLIVMALDHVEWEVLRRYSAFSEVADKIKSKSSIKINAPFPEKKRDSWINKGTNDDISTRQMQLKVWLSEVVTISNESYRPPNSTNAEIKCIQDILNEFLEIESHSYLFQTVNNAGSVYTTPRSK